MIPIWTAWRWPKGSRRTWSFSSSRAPYTPGSFPEGPLEGSNRFISRVEVSQEGSSLTVRLTLTEDAGQYTVSREYQGNDSGPYLPPLPAGSVVAGKRAADRRPCGEVRRRPPPREIVQPLQHCVAIFEGPIIDSHFAFCYIETATSASKAGFTSMWTCGEIPEIGARYETSDFVCFRAGLRPVPHGLFPWGG